MAKDLPTTPLLVAGPLKKIPFFAASLNYTHNDKDPYSEVKKGFGIGSKTFFTTFILC